jgi:CheY-like chemotaxis protein
MCIVLIIEDHAGIRRPIRPTLELDGHDIHEVAGVIESLAQARRLQPDAVRLDNTGLATPFIPLKLVDAIHHLPRPA